MNLLKKIIKFFIPKRLFKLFQPIYHGFLGIFASYWLGRPAQNLKIIGVTGTAGKSSTVIMLAEILNFAGKKTGYITTAGWSDGVSKSENFHGLSMPGGFLLHSQIAQIKNKGCEFLILECTSEGLAQNRHAGIKFLGGVFTNLSPAHIDSHGSYENYRAAKDKLFQAVESSRLKENFLFVNLSDKESAFYSRHQASQKFGAAFNSQNVFKNISSQKFSGQVFNIETQPDNFHAQIKVEGVNISTKLIGEFNSYNIGMAVSCAKILGVDFESAKAALQNFGKIPGRMESIEAGQDFKVFVDYAPEPAAMQASLESLQNIPHNKIIHVFGSTGGHRDVAKRFEFGKISAQYSNRIIVTNDDVYDSDPQQIARDIQTGIAQNNAHTKDVEVILDRRQAITRAISVAQKDDIVIITGKGSEQFLVLPNNKKINWDDRKICKEILQTI